MSDLYTPWDDRFRNFVWKWNGSQWVYQEMFSNLTYHSHQDAEVGSKQTKYGVTKWAEASQPGWFYIGMYYFNGSGWQSEEGEQFFVAPMAGLNWSGDAGAQPSVLPPSPPVAGASGESVIPTKDEPTGTPKPYNWAVGLAAALLGGGTLYAVARVCGGGTSARVLAGGAGVIAGAVVGGRV